MAYAESNTSNDAGFGGFISGSRYFGWQVTCEISPCDGSPYSVLSVHGITLVAIDNQAPTITPSGATNIINEGGKWIRGGNWPASFSASDDSGVCIAQEKIGSQAVQTQVDWLANPHTWTQCWASTSINQTLDTTQYANGSLPVTYFASDDANPENQTAPTVTLHVDNSPVAVTLTGPTDAPATGTQYITATGTAGPSGVGGISCSVDGSPYRWHPGASAQLPVTGLGTHTATCVAYNQAIDYTGRVASSAPSSFAMSIREPMIMGLWATRLENPLHCHRGYVRIHTAGRWVTVHVHGRPVWVYRRGHVIRRLKTVCHPRTVLRRTIVWRTVLRHGHKVRVARVRYIRVVVPPKVARSTTERVAFGRVTRVSGWIGTSGFLAAAGQPVEILAAPDDGSGAFTPIAATVSAADGSWSAALPPGPSRIIEAVFPGSTTLEPASSNEMTITVPADVQLRIRPRHTHWGGKIRITGRLLGGYIPPAGELVLLRIGWPGGSTEIGHVITDKAGRFHATYRFLRGNGTERYWIWAQSARESDYPFAPASSRRVGITVTQG